MIKEECHSFISFGCQAVMGAVRIGGVQERRRWELVYPHAWFGASCIRWPGPGICHRHVILSLSSPAVLFGCTGEQVGACLGTLMPVIHPTFSHADFILFFLLRTNRRRRQLNTLQPGRRSRYTLSMWPQHSDSIWAVMLTVRSSALIIRTLLAISGRTYCPSV